MDDIRWGRALLNGLFVWLISLAMTAVPGVLYAFAQGSRLGGPDADPLAVGQQVGGEVAALYADNWLLIGAVVAITAVLILWRGRAVATGTWHLRWANGLIVGATPAVLSLLAVLCGGLGALDVVTVLAYLGAGLLGGLLARP